MMNTLARVTDKLKASKLSKTWWRNIRVRVEGKIRRMRMIRKGMVGFDRIRENQ
jgi:hypothetical protein